MSETKLQCYYCGGTGRNCDASCRMCEGTGEGRPHSWFPKGTGTWLKCLGCGTWAKDQAEADAIDAENEDCIYG